MKQDTATEQPTSQPQTNGETASKKSAFNPTDRSRMAELRRRYKKLFGFKPTGISEADLASMVENTERERENRAAARAGSAQQWEDNIPTDHMK